MEKIIVYGYADKSPEYAFKTENDLIEYLTEGLFTKSKGRHHFTQSKKADIIVVSREGFAYGHLNVEDMENPTPQDKKEYPKVRKVYIIESSEVYENRVRLSDIEITGLSFGKPITRKEFGKIISRAGTINKYPKP